jgi:hypothetical protein
MLRLELKCPDLHICPEKSFSKSQTDTASDLYGTCDETSFSKSQRAFGDSGGTAVVAVLMIGMLAKFDAMQLFHLSR